MAAAGQTIEEFDEQLKWFTNEFYSIEPYADIFEVVKATTIQEVHRDGNEKRVPKYTKMSNGKLLSDVFSSIMALM